MKNKKTKHHIFALLLTIAGITLACVWFSWKLAVVIFLLMWANNIDSKISLIKSFENYTQALKDIIKDELKNKKS